MTSTTCRNGHINPPRRPSGNCIPCEKERYARDAEYRERRKAQSRRRRERVASDPELKAARQKYHQDYNKKNRKKLNEQGKERYYGNPEVRYRTRLRRIGVEATPELISHLINHDDRCDICGEPDTGRWKELAIDHCHETHQFRGMLCSNCNRAVGLFQDDTKRLESAIKYLKKERP